MKAEIGRFNPLRWLKFKGWFLFDLPYFVRTNGFTKGAELGAKSGRSMFYMLRANKSLFLIGIDKWEVIQGGAYKRNNLNEAKCKKRLKRFSHRVSFIKNDAINALASIDDRSLDFVHYDLQSIPMKGRHQQMIKLWTAKIKDGGMLIGRDFRDFRGAFYGLGFTEKDILPCKIGTMVSVRLEYVIIKS